MVFIENKEGGGGEEAENWKIGNNGACTVTKIDGSKSIYLFMGKAMKCGRMEKTKRRDESARHTDICNSKW